MSTEAGFFVGKEQGGRRKCTILRSDSWYILWIAFCKKSSIVL